MKRKVSSASIRKAVKRSQPTIRLGKHVDILMHLSAVLFVKNVAKEAALDAKSSRSRTIQLQHIEQSIKDALQRHKG